MAHPRTLSVTRPEQVAESLREAVLEEYGEEGIREVLEDTLGVPLSRPKYVKGNDISVSVEMMRRYVEAIADNAESCARKATRRSAEHAASITDPARVSP
ncbi:MAG: hypothetical protein E6R04_06665 [Spirochaetes bacterium]|nr:MAG: hypothetical protein E6R04_06665 [Spirochaetota bacterium]